MALKTIATVIGNIVLVKKVHQNSFTKGQLIKAGEAGCIDRTPALNRFMNFLLRYYELTKEEADEICE